MCVSGRPDRLPLTKHLKLLQSKPVSSADLKSPFLFFEGKECPPRFLTTASAPFIAL